MAMETTQVPVETTENGGRAGDEVREQRGVGVVDAAVDGRGGIEAGLRGDGGVTGPRMSAARRRGGKSGRQPAVDQRGEVAARRVPEVGVAAERGAFGGRARPEAERPVLRVGEDAAARANPVGKRLAPASRSGRRC